MFRLKSLHLMAIFILIYVGVEVTLGGESCPSLPIGCWISVIRAGWIVTYVINLRGGGPDSGYISSGFFGGTCNSVAIAYDSI